MQKNLNKQNKTKSQKSSKKISSFKQIPRSTKSKNSTKEKDDCSITPEEDSQQSYSNESEEDDKDNDNEEESESEDDQDQESNQEDEEEENEKSTKKKSSQKSKKSKKSQANSEKQISKKSLSKSNIKGKVRKTSLKIQEKKANISQKSIPHIAQEEIKKDDTSKDQSLQASPLIQPLSEQQISYLPIIRKKMGKAQFISSKQGQNPNPKQILPFQSQQTINYGSLKIIQQNSAQTQQIKSEQTISGEKNGAELNLRLNGRQDSIDCDKIERSPTLSIGDFSQHKNFRTDSIRKQRTGTVKLSMISSRLKNINQSIMVNQIDMRRKKTQINLLNPFSIINWLIEFFSQYYILNDINKRTIDSKQKDYFDNQIIYWNHCILFSIIFMYPLYYSITAILNQNLSLFDTSNLFVHILTQNDILTPFIIFGYIFYITTVLIAAIYRYKSNQESSLFQKDLQDDRLNFKNVFTKYNWRISQESQLLLFINHLFQETKTDLEKYDKQTDKVVKRNPASQTLQRMRKLILVMILASSLASLIFLNYIIYSYIPSDVVTYIGVAAVVKGFMIIIISDLSSKINQGLIKKIWKQNIEKNEQEIQILSLIVQYLFINFSIFTYMTMHLLVLSGHSQYFFNIISKDSKVYSCKYEQIGFQLGGLYVATLLYQLLKNLAYLIIKNLKVNYQKESVCKLQQQLILNCLAFFSFFSFFCASIIQIVFFNLEKQIFRRRQIISSNSYYKIKKDYILIHLFNSISVFLLFGILLTLQTELPDENSNDTSKICTPYGISLGQFYLTYFNSNKVLKLIFNLITWTPLLYISIILLLCYFLIHKDKNFMWHLKLEEKQDELTNIKTVHQQNILSLSKILQNIEQNVIQYRNSINQNNLSGDDYNINANNNEQVSQGSIKNTSQNHSNDNLSIYNETFTNSSFFSPYKVGISNSNQINRQNSHFSQFQINKIDSQQQTQHTPFLTHQKSGYYKSFFKEQLNTEEEASDSKLFLQSQTGQIGQGQQNQLISKKTFFH